jgi:hypothetical protein
LVLALVERGRKVSFGEVWLSLQVDDRGKISLRTNQHGSPSIKLLK